MDAFGLGRDDERRYERGADQLSAERLVLTPGQLALRGYSGKATGLSGNNQAALVGEDD